MCYFCNQKCDGTLNMGKFKDIFQRFKQWQRQPPEFHITNNEERICKCCGYHYVGNYCPCCSQKADMARISWHSVRRGLMDIWGLGTRSLPYSIWQLLWRPGYFIGDYISGKRQVSFPPVKMLFVVAVICSFLLYWLLPEVFHVQSPGPSEETMEKIPFLVWNKKYYSWIGLFTAVMFILPTWLMFRYAPRYPKHSIPEGFFIQVLMAILTMVINIFSQLIFIKHIEYSVYLTGALLVLYYFVAYRQLFGYGVWGTIWRQLFMWISFLSLMMGALYLTGGIVIENTGLNTMQYAGYKTGWAMLFFFMSIVSLGIGCVLNKKSTRNQANNSISTD